jgi:hypothetical protein
MKKTIQKIKEILAIISYVAAFITIIDFFLNFKSKKEKLTDFINHFDLALFGQILQMVGIIIIISGILVLLFIKIFNRYEPKRDLADIIAPFLLSKDVIGDTQEKFEKKRRRFIIIRIGVCIIIIGFVIVVVMKLWDMNLS